MKFETNTDLETSFVVDRLDISFHLILYSPKTQKEKKSNIGTINKETLLFKRLLQVDKPARLRFWDECKYKYWDMIIIAGIANQSSPFNVFSCGRAANRDGDGAQIEKG